MSFSTLQQTDRNLIAAQQAALHNARKYGALSDDEMMVMARFGAEEGRLADAVAAVPTEAWFRSIGLAVTAGTLSAAAADAIRTGLGSPSDSMPASTLATAAEHICVEATTLDVDRLTLLARQLRDQIDETGIADR